MRPGRSQGASVISVESIRLVRAYRRQRARTLARTRNLDVTAILRRLFEREQHFEHMVGKSPSRAGLNTSTNGMPELGESNTAIGIIAMRQRGLAPISAAWGCHVERQVARLPTSEHRRTIEMIWVGCRDRAPGTVDLEVREVVVPHIPTHDHRGHST